MWPVSIPVAPRPFCFPCLPIKTRGYHGTPEVVGLGDQSRRFRTCSALWVQRPRLHHLPWALVNDQSANRTHRTAGALGAAPSERGCSVFGASLLCQLLSWGPLAFFQPPLYAVVPPAPRLPLRLLCTSSPSSRLCPQVSAGVDSALSPDDTLPPPPGACPGLLSHPK